jgi:PAS domain-containing protein
VPADLLLLQDAIAKSTATGAGYELTLAIVRSDGTMGTALARAETIADDDGRIVKLVGTFQDITERHRQTELQLREYDERLGLAASVARIGSWEWDARTGEHQWDDAVYQMYGVSRGQPLPQLREVWQAAVHPDDRTRAEIHGRDALAGRAPFNIVYRMNTPTGVRYIHAIAVVHRDEQGLPTRVVGMNKDVTEQRMAQCFGEQRGVAARGD